MPKQLYKINNFSGGINNLKDPRDLADNELSEAKNISLEHQGKVISCPRVASHGTAQAITSDVVSGYGLIAFEADYQIATNTVTFASDLVFNANASGNNI